MANNAPKISMAFGFKPPPSKPLNGKKRLHAALGYSDDEEDTTVHQEISHFDQAAGGAIHVARAKKPTGLLVIPSKSNSGGLGYKRKQTSGLPVTDNGEDIIITKKEVIFGLTVMEKKEEAKPERAATPSKEEPEAKTEEEMALDALMGNKTSNLTIPVMSEDDAYRRDVLEAPDEPTLEDYMAMPVADFGAACLRGMGWNDTESLDTGKGANNLKPKIHERRPALLGVGAKPSSAVGVELGEWGKPSMKKGAQALEYTPVVLKNKITGETLSEQQLEVEMVDQEKSSSLMVFDDRSSKDDRRRKDDYRDRDRDSRRNRDRDDYDRKRRDDDGRDRKHRDRSRTPRRDERKDKKRRYRSRSRSSSKDQYRSSRSERKEQESYSKRR
jgi:hypothetical protein